MKQFYRNAAVVFTLLAFLLTGSFRSSAGFTNRAAVPDAFVAAANAAGKRLYVQSRFGEAHESFQQAAERADSLRDFHAAAMNRNNMAACSTVELNFRAARTELQEAREIAERNGETTIVTYSLNNLAGLYLHMGQPENAMRIAYEGLTGSSAPLPALKYQLALALVQLGRYDDALTAYRDAISGMLDHGDLETAAAALSSLGAASLKANRLAEAEDALSQGLFLVRIHHLRSLARILEGLGRLKARQGDIQSATRFYDAALAAPTGVTPGWKLFASRGQFRLQTGDLPGALADFRQARAMSARMRLDIVPADQDRVAIESGLSELAQGFVEAGNRLALRTNDRKLLEETFNIAEQDRLWSLRALVPGTADWRERLPQRYWEALARYQSLEQGAQTGAESTSLRDDLRRMEADAAGTASAEAGGSSLDHIANVLRDDSVLFSFYVTRTSSWLWVVDRNGVQAFPLPSFENLEREAAAFTSAVRDGGAESSTAGQRLYRSLFANVPARMLAHSQWLLEPDGPLYGVPFAALAMDDSAAPAFLVQNKTIQSIPGAPLLQGRMTSPAGEMVAVGDAVYNAADPRYRGTNPHPVLNLPRLPGSGEELEACRRAWGYDRAQLLTGQEASVSAVNAAVKTNPSILHFATHVVPSGSDFNTGLIALSLNSNGTAGLLSPREIVARRTSAALVVMDGCHSAQAQALPGSGLMGLTRAWIGAGATSVIATHWDIPDESSRSLMSGFYRALATHSDEGIAGALRRAQMEAIRAGQPPSAWAGYFLESRSQ